MTLEVTTCQPQYPSSASFKEKVHSRQATLGYFIHTPLTFAINHAQHLTAVPRMPPREQAPRRNVAAREPPPGGTPRRASGATQLITFVDSQDPNSRSAIQRHTAHHSNAQRRDARMRSLRSNRPRLLEWQRRPSADVEALSVTSPHSSTSSASLSPAPTQRPALSAPGDTSTEKSSNDLPATNLGTTPYRSLAYQDRNLVITPAIPDDLIESCLDQSCPLASKEVLRQVMQYISGRDTCLNSLLMAYMLACRAHHLGGQQSEADLNEAKRHYGRGTRLLRDRLGKPDTASSDENIQAVLLLIAYASDTGSTDEVPIHVGALTRMIRQRGGWATLQTTIDSTLMTQLQTVSKSVHRHLTLECAAECPHGLRFPMGLEALDLLSKDQT